jgi:hypothetical protein
MVTTACWLLTAWNYCERKTQKDIAVDVDTAVDTVVNMIGSPANTWRLQLRLHSAALDLDCDGINAVP